MARTRSNTPVVDRQHMGSQPASGQAAASAPSVQGPAGNGAMADRLKASGFLCGTFPSLPWCTPDPPQPERCWTRGSHYGPSEVTTWQPAPDSYDSCRDLNQTVDQDDVHQDSGTVRWGPPSRSR